MKESQEEDAATSPISLTSSFVLPNSCEQLLYFVRLQTRSGVVQGLRKLGVNTPPTFDLKSLEPKQSNFVVRSIEIIKELEPDYLFNHNMRAYYFALAYSIKSDIKVDRELLFVAAMFHDLGLVEQVQEENTDHFELVGARKAYEFALEYSTDDEDWTGERAALLHEAIALHTSLKSMMNESDHITEHVLSVGTACDVTGMGLEHIHENVVDKAVQAHPRLEMKIQITAAAEREIKRMQNGCNFTIFKKWGMYNMIKNAPFDS
mmetsp:Transcript_18736/g.24481  ORF Transcript_18736/g.24481 Transcript_18736/m.24481 type:complete len:263 (+) Transcript_18736:254-1042(+)